MQLQSLWEEPTPRVSMEKCKNIWYTHRLISARGSGNVIFAALGVICHGTVTARAPCFDKHSKRNILIKISLGTVIDFKLTQSIIEVIEDTLHFSNVHSAVGAFPPHLIAGVGRMLSNSCARTENKKREAPDHSTRCRVFHFSSQPETETSNRSKTWLWNTKPHFLFTNGNEYTWNKVWNAEF